MFMLCFGYFHVYVHGGGLKVEFSLKKLYPSPEQKVCVTLIIVFYFIIYDTSFI
jgi:hypothetical protein